MQLEWTTSEWEQAVKRVRSSGIEQTPIKHSLWLSDLIGADVYLKFENLHEGGSFKLRGAQHFLFRHREVHGELPSKVITASGGNHGMAVAVACKRLGIPCTVVIPEVSFSESKRHLFEDLYGAKLETAGDCWQDSHDAAQKIVQDLESQGIVCCYIHPFLHEWIIQGAGTMAAEIHQQMSDGMPDVILASLGGGGMLSGIISYLRAANLKDSIQVASVETEGADYFYQSWKKGESIRLDKITSIATTLGASTGSPETFDLFVKNIDHPMLVSDAEAVKALFDILEHDHLLVDPSCSATIAALVKNADKFKGKRVMVIICGGNPHLSECLRWKEKFNIV